MTTVQIAKAHSMLLRGFNENAAICGIQKLYTISTKWITYCIHTSFNTNCVPCQIHTKQAMSENVAEDAISFNSDHTRYELWKRYTCHLTKIAPISVICKWATTYFWRIHMLCRTADTANYEVDNCGFFKRKGYF